MASSPSPQTIAHYNGALQWHHVHSSKIGRHPRPHHSTLSWHPQVGHPLPTTIARYNGTLAMAPCPLPQSWSSPSPATIAHYNGTLRWHSNGTASSDPAMAPWHHVQSAKVVRRPLPLLEVRTPIAIAIWGNIYFNRIHIYIYIQIYIYINLYLPEKTSIFKYIHLQKLSVQTYNMYIYLYM